MIVNVREEGSYTIHSLQNILQVVQLSGTCASLVEGGYD